MIKTRALDWRRMPSTVAVTAMVLLAGASVQALAAEPVTATATPVAFFGSSPSSMGHSVITSRGPAFVGGHVGSMDTFSLPGGGGQAFLMNNGNGSSTVFAPGLTPQTVITPR
jgi:hypothetical protein